MKDASFECRAPLEVAEGCAWSRRARQRPGMEPPRDIGLPFFAYGIFKPGQLAFFQLRDLINEVIEPAAVKGGLLLRDGLPIIDPALPDLVVGALVGFEPRQAAKAYARIAAMEPGSQYCWQVAEADGMAANVLVGRSPQKGSDYPESEWDGWEDPLFTVALEVVHETLDAEAQLDWPPKSLFRLQMAYLLLWSAIERYVSLRYGLGGDVMKHVRHLAEEPEFGESLKRHVHGPHRPVYRADRPRSSEVCDPYRPERALDYYYQVRSNVAHRGKGAFDDFELLRRSLGELLPVFREVIDAARRDAAFTTTG